LFHFHTWIQNTSVIFAPSFFLKTFCLFMMAIPGVSLWHFHVCMCIITQIGSSPPLFSFLP
jgi:hypothetical protein